MSAPSSATDALDVTCSDHWHCDPALAPHACDRPNRTRPCPTCGEATRPVTGPDGDNPMTRSRVRALRDSFDEADDPDLALACDRALGLDYPGDESDEECWPGIVETSWETCAAAYNARLGKEGR